MRIRLPQQFTMLLALATGLHVAASAATQHTVDTAAESARVIVKMKLPLAQAASVSSTPGLSITADADASRVRMQALGRRTGITIDDAHAVGTRAHLALAHGISSAELARRFAAQSDVEYAVVDQRRYARQVTPNDSLYAAGQTSPYPAAGQWYLNAPDTTLVSAVNATAAWAIATGNSSIVVAVLDTGVRFDHVDLKDKLLPGYNMISSAPSAGNGTGRSNDASDLGDWLTAADISANPTDFPSYCKVENTSSWHGTQVAGIIGAASNNSLGIAGLAWGVKILPVRVLGKCGGYDSDIIAGMRWAAGLSVSGVPDNPNPAKVLNMSLGADSTCSQAYIDALNDIVGTQHVVVVAAAGNSVGLKVESPGNCPGVIAVGGLRNFATKNGYSSLGPEVALSAPGGNCINVTGACVYPIVTTTNTGTTTPVANGSAYTDSLNPSLGTSFSSPMVAGTAALMLSVDPTLLPSDVRRILTTTTRTFPTSGGTSGIAQCAAPSTSVQDECYCTTTTCGAGMLDAGAAVAATAAPQASIVQTPAQARIGQLVTFDASASRPGPGASDTLGYQWQLLVGGGIVTELIGSLSGSSVSASPSAAGSFSVRLTITNSLGLTSSNVIAVNVSSTNAVPSTASGGGGGGGGGNIDGLTIAGLLASMLAVATVRRRERMIRPVSSPGADTHEAP